MVKLAAAKSVFDGKRERWQTIGVGPGVEIEKERFNLSL